MFINGLKINKKNLKHKFLKINKINLKNYKKFKNQLLKIKNKNKLKKMKVNLLES